MLSPAGIDAHVGRTQLGGSQSMRIRTHKVSRRLAVAATLTLVGLGATTLSTAADAKVVGDPAGNNGTVKITPHAEDDGVPQNTPHVACPFDIEWYGFDEGADIVSTVTFTMQAPTSDVGLSGTELSQVFVGGDPAGGAGTDFDGEATHTPGSQGADTKHKVFWVTPCDDGPPESE
jgi:hypothetical protein